MVEAKGPRSEKRGAQGPTKRGDRRPGSGKRPPISGGKTAGGTTSGGKGFKTRTSKGKGGERASPPPAAEPLAGLGARQLATSLVAAVLRRGRTLDEALAEGPHEPAAAPLEPRDRAFAHLLAATMLRHLGRLEAIVEAFLERPLPAEGRSTQLVLIAGAAQLLLLATPPHAAINLAVEQCRRDRQGTRYANLANAVLRRVATEGVARFAALDMVEHDVPAWMRERWNAAFGPEAGRAIAAASLCEAPLDLTMNDPATATTWAERLGGMVLPTGSVRLADHAPVVELAGFSDGAWWVQDAAAALPALLLGPCAGLTIADLCAAPGGKTGQLASAGARVLAVDRSAGRLERLSENMRRLGVADRVEVIAADVGAWRPDTPLDAVILDAPCTATGTIRRHPDLLRLKSAGDVARLAQLQARLLIHAAGLLAPGGRLIFCTCSLEPEEGPDRIAELLANRPDFSRLPITADEIGGEASWITPLGDLRTLPSHLVLPPPYRSGIDGFYAARLIRRR